MRRLGDVVSRRVARPLGWYLPRGIVPFDFDLAEVVFTPGMRIAAGDGAWAGAIMHQGAWNNAGTPDNISYPRGSLRGNLTGIFYDAFDPYQGTVSFTITPEWDGDDGKDHYLWYGGSNNYVRKLTTDFLRFRIGGENVSVDVSAWTAGTAYYIVCSWDAKRTIDGTNYARLSINDAHTFGIETQPTATQSTATPRIGSTVASLSADAKISGLRIDRFVWYDGLYGDDLWSGTDLVAYHYNGGAGADVAAVIGGWDETLGVPTTSAVGELVTTDDHAHRFPWEDQELKVWGCWDGYGPNQSSVITCNGNNTVVNCGSDASLDDLPASGTITAGIYVRMDEQQEQFAFSKGVGGATGWRFFPQNESSSISLRAQVMCADTIAESRLSNVAPYLIQDGKWHYIVMYYDDAGDRKIYFSIDGRWATAYSLQRAGVGAYQSDAASDLLLFNSEVGNKATSGAGAWAAIWSDDHHTVGTDFIPPKDAPDAGGNLVESWKCDDRAATVTATVNSPTNDGTLSNGDWEYKWFDQGSLQTPVGMAFYTENDGINFFSGANIDDLFLGDCTIEFYARFPAGLTTNRYALAKSDTASTVGWGIYSASATTLRLRANFADNDLLLDFPNVADEVWHHFAIDWDQGTLTGRSLLDGIEVGTDTAVGAYQSDAAQDCLVNARGAIGTSDMAFAIGAIRLSDNRRYTGNAFVPPARFNWPANDANAELITRMNDGAGIAITDYSGNGYHGTGTFGQTTQWFNSEDSELWASGERIYNWGYMLGATGTAHLASVIANADYVFKPSLFPDMSGRGRWAVRLWDRSNGAQIGADFPMPRYHGTHDGGNNSADLVDTGARWPQALVGWQVYNIDDGSEAAITSVSGTMTSLSATLAGGVDNDWDVGDDYLIRPPNSRPYSSHPWSEPFVASMPTGCVLAEVQLINLDGVGCLGVHQVEMIESALVHGDHEAGAGDPFILTDWFNQDLDAGDTVAEGVAVHAGTQSVRWDLNAIVEGMIDLNAPAVVDRFYTLGLFSHGDGSAGFEWGTTNPNRGHLQYNAAQGRINTPHDAFWSHTVGIWRAVQTTMYPFIAADAGAAGDRWTDDAYCFEMVNVALTVAPASRANSLESGGIRIDGYDAGVIAIPVGVISAQSGLIRFRFRPRHNATNLGVFGEAATVYFLELFGDANNWIQIRGITNNLQIWFNDGGGLHNAAWNVTGLISEDVEYLCEIQWTDAEMQLIVDETVRATITTPINFATVPTVWHVGSRDTGDRQGDAVFKNP